MSEHIDAFKMSELPQYGEVGCRLIPEKIRRSEFAPVSERAVFLGMDTTDNHVVCYSTDTGVTHTTRTFK
jgi:hypothetical protein